MQVLVMGASRGIGLELVRQCLKDGQRVVATARDEAGLAHLRSLGATAFALDVADPASVRWLGAQLTGLALDQAWYVAGVFAKEDAKVAPSQAAFDAVMHTNVLGAMQVMAPVAPCVAAARGKLVFVTSDMGHITSCAGSYGWLYRVSKAALNMAVVAAQADHPQVRFVLMHPGWVQTDMGSAQAPLKPHDSVAGMLRTVAAQAAPGGHALVPSDVPYLRWDGTPFDGW